ncbi:MAG: transposase [bacterium]
MSYDPRIHHRRSIRLKGYDYSQAGAYFITICTHNRECVLGEVIDGQMHLSQFGKIVVAEWLKTGEIRENVELDVFEVMPNHMHSILVITHQIEIVGATGPVALAGTTDQQPNVVTTIAPNEEIEAIHAEETVATRWVATADETHAVATTDSNQAVNMVQLAEVGVLHPPVAPVLKPGSLGAIMAQFQSIATKKIRKAGLHHFKWQRGYFEHIIRNERALYRIRQYIMNNPANWEYDQENRNNISPEDKKRFWKNFLTEN